MSFDFDLIFNYDFIFRSQSPDQHGVLNSFNKMEEITLNEDDTNSAETPAVITDDDNDAQQVEGVSSADVEEPGPEASESKDDMGNDEAEVLSSLVAKFQTLELKSTEYLNEIENQKKVIELLRVEAENKDKERAVIEEEFRNFKKSSETRYKTLSDETGKKINELKRAYEHANRDKESMVIKYAMGEKDILIARRGKEEAEKKYREALKDGDSYQYKIKTLTTERVRLQGLCEARGQETNQARKELDKVREEVKGTEAKLAATTNKLKAEEDSHKDTKENLDRTFKELLDVQGSIDDIKKEYSDLIAKAREEEDNLKKKEIIQEKELSVKLMIDSAAAAELETLKKKYKEAIEENSELSVKVQSNEKELTTYEASISELKGTITSQKSEIVDLYAKCAEIESVRLQLGCETEKVASREEEISRLRQESAELISDMSSCRRKEMELLEFTQKLTDKNVNLQSEFSSVESKAATLEDEHRRLLVDLTTSETKLSTVMTELEEERDKRKTETELLARKLAEKVKALETASQKVVDANNEVEVVRRKNQGRVRELSKELAAMKKKLDGQESGGGVGGGGGGGGGQGVRGDSPGQLSLSSRCSSSSSLSREVESHQDNDSRLGLSSLPSEAQQIPNMPLGDTQTLLVEKIVKLQKNCARRQVSVGHFIDRNFNNVLLRKRSTCSRNISLN